jgi:hypothetical protein
MSPMHLIVRSFYPLEGITRFRVPGSPSVYFLGGSKDTTHNNCTHAKESLGRRLDPKHIKTKNYSEGSGEEKVNKSSGTPIVSSAF